MRKAGSETFKDFRILTYDSFYTFAELKINCCLSPSLIKYLESPIFAAVSEAGKLMNAEVYVVGGYVRDLIMGRPSDDIDFVVVGSGIELAGRVADLLGDTGNVNVFKNFGTAMFTFGHQNIEFVGARKESYRYDSRKPVVEDGSLEDDQRRRDFTINAMAISLNADTFGQLIDPFDGMGDIASRLIRTPLGPDVTFSDDPLRMMRAIRFASQLQFTIVPEAYDSITRNRERIRIVSMERIADEMNKIILSPVPSVGFKLLMSTGLLDIIFPEMSALKGAEYVEGRGHKDNFFHTLEVLDKLSRNTDNLWLRWAAIMHDIGKPVTKRFDPEVGWTFHTHELVGSRMVQRIFKRMKLPMNEKMRYVQKLVLLHLRPIVLSEEIVSDSAVRRLLFEAGDDVDDLMLLCEADITSKNPEKVKRYLNNFRLVRQKLKDTEEKDRVRNFQPPVSGELIMSTFGIRPGREVGIIKNAIKEAILDGEICNNFAEAFEFMIVEGKKLGLNPV